MSNNSEPAGEMPLHGAAFCSVTLRGSDPTKKELDKTAYTEIVRLLIEAGADVNARTNENVPSDMGPRLSTSHFSAFPAFLGLHGDLETWSWEMGLRIWLSVRIPQFLVPSSEFPTPGTIARE